VRDRLVGEFVFERVLRGIEVFVHVAGNFLCDRTCLPTDDLLNRTVAVDCSLHQLECVWEARSDTLHRADLNLLVGQLDPYVELLRSNKLTTGKQFGEFALDGGDSTTNPHGNLHRGHRGSVKDDHRLLVLFGEGVGNR